MEKAKIELQNISKSYYSEAAVTQALRKVSLTFVHGEFVAITGESGSGKSTLLNIIGGMDSFDEGEMIVNGIPTFQYTDEDWENYRRSQIGYVFQDYSLIGHYTALDNITGALLIMGKNKEESHITAMEYLKKVGLAGYETHPATELSSGQKQRLSIARALAKNTGIIVADEPTGNLDSETGRQIVELLKELSKDSLVIMVTHNYSQAEPYVTRKIRLHEGTVISDITENTPGKTLISVNNTRTDINVQANNNYDEISFKEKLYRYFIQSKEHNRLAMWFSLLNIKTQHGMAIMFTSFLFIISIVSFLLIGELHLQNDDIFTKEYSQSAFRRKDPVRIIAAHKDDSDITEEDLKTIRKIPYVETADSCSYANDINFYLERGTDYKYIYGQNDISGFGQTASEGGKSVSFLNMDRFVMSDDNITEKDLAEGKLPKSRNEIVIYSNDKNIIGTEYPCYFTWDNVWDVNEYYYTELKISGILKKETSQVYFSKELCNMLSIYIYPKKFLICNEYNNTINDFKKKISLIPVISDNLKENNMRISDNFYNTFGNVLSTGKSTLQFLSYNEDDSLADEIKSEEINIISDGINNSSPMFLEISKNFYYKYYNIKSNQVSVYISNYAKTDKVLHKLNKKGYKAISTYRVSTEEYVENLVNERLIIICICSLGLIILFAAGILILRSLLKIRIKDYFVLKFIGMKFNIINKTCRNETCLYSIFAMIATIIIMMVIRMSNIKIISDIMWYYTFGAYLQFFLYNLILSVLAAKAFNHILKGRLKA